MSKDVLNIISEAMKSLGLAYGFGEYSADPVVYPYFVGEYTETEMFDESGMTESTFLKKMFDFKGNLWYYFKRVGPHSTTTQRRF